MTRMYSVILSLLVAAGIGGIRAQSTELITDLVTDLTTDPVANDLSTLTSHAMVTTTQNQPPKESGCPIGWYLLHDMCYTLLGYGDNHQLDFRDAESDCQTNGFQYNGTDGHLASVPYDGINALVTSLMKIVPQDVWIGLWSNSSGELTWLDTGLEYTYENFARQEPSLDLTMDACIKLSNDPDNPGRWVSVLCNEKAAYICQMSPQLQWDPNEPVISRCGDPEYQSYMLSCYKFVWENATFENAKSYCEADGSTLASFTDRYELAFGETMLHFHQIENTWIGLERDQNRQYRWLDGWPLTYTEWDHNEPTKNGCVALGHDGWLDSHCQMMFPFFCKKSEESAHQPEEPIDGQCLPNWLKWNHSCYFFPENLAPTDWDSANTACHTTYAGSNLASIHSDEEGVFLRTEATLVWGEPYAFWIGLELAEDGYYDWKDGTLLNYQNWQIDEGEPSIRWPDHGRGFGYISADTSQWHDGDCYNTDLRFVCKSPTSYALPTQSTSTEDDSTTESGVRTTSWAIPETTTPKLQQPSALTAGEIVAVVICIIIVVSVVVVIVLIYLRKSGKLAGNTGSIDGGENAISGSDGQSIINKVYDDGGGEEAQL